MAQHLTCGKPVRIYPQVVDKYIDTGLGGHALFVTGRRQTPGHCGDRARCTGVADGQKLTRFRADSATSSVVYDVTIHGGAPPGGDGTMRVVIAAPVRLYRDGLADAFERDDRFAVSGTSATCADTHALLSSDVDVLLVDADMPGSGALVRQVSLRPHPKVVVLGVEEIKEEILALVEAGIAGYVTREGSVADLFASVECAARGETIASPRIVAGIMERLVALTRERRSVPENGTLTSRERQIASLIDDGLSNRDIARRLDIELPTVKNHVHNILDKLHVHRRGEAVARLRTTSPELAGRRRD